MLQNPLQHINVDNGPVAIGVLDLDDRTVAWRTPADQRATTKRAMLLLRHRGWPVGVQMVSLVDGEPAEAIGPQLISEIPANSARGALPTEPVSVIICSRDRPELLRRAITSMLTLGDQLHELIVVDNAPSDDASRLVVASFGDRVRYIVEPVPGLARARNSGLEACSGNFVVFTDDDVEPDAAWLDVLSATFAAHPGAVCVSGGVLPASLSTPAELRFQEFGGYLLDFQETELHLSLDPSPSPLFPFHPKLLGTGANMAFRTEALRHLGGFDPVLGAGTPARGGEDIDIAVRVLLAGHLLVRQPAAVLWHPSHTDDVALLRQIEGYGCGLAAVFTKFMSQRSTAPAVLRRAGAGARLLFNPRSSKNSGRSDTYPAALRQAELRGMRQGPLAYRTSLRQHRRAMRSDAA
jgi:O-antigen biosynthesis protein